MTIISWGNGDVRVYAAQSWVSLAPRFAAQFPVIIDQLEAALSDPVAAVRVQVAGNLQVISIAAPERMWAMGERIASQESHAEIIASYLGASMRRFSHSAPERCEAVLAIARGRLNNDLVRDSRGVDELQECLGGWVAQLFAGQGRTLARTWLEEWAADPERYGDLLKSFASSLREAFFQRYRPGADTDDCAVCDRAQEGLGLTIKLATTISAEAYSVLASQAADADKQAAGKRYGAAERVLYHAMNQLFFGSRAHAESRNRVVGLPDSAAMKRFLTDYAEILEVLAGSREPGTLHNLIKLYEFLIPGDPIAVFEAIYAILRGRGEAEGYHYESLGSASVVQIVRRYIADHRSIFEEDGRRAKLVAILQLFSEVGWSEAIKLLYDLPDLLR